MSEAAQNLPEAKRRLRIGLLLDSTRVPAWIERIVADLAASPHAEIALAVLRRSRPPGGRWRRLGEIRRHVLYELYARLDRRLLGQSPDPFARRSLDSYLEGVEILHVEPEASRWADRFVEADVAAIQARELDVLLRFGFRILRGGVLGAARHGIWSYHHDDNRVIRGGPPGFWEVMEDHPVTGTILQVLTERLDGGRVIYRSWSPTHRRSVIRNREHAYWKGTAFVGRCLEALAATGDPAAGAAREDEASAGFHPYPHRLYRKPTNLRSAPLLARFAARSARGWLADRTSRNQWFLAYRFHSAGGEAPGGPRGEPPEELFRFRPLLPPRDRFWADPFPLRRNGRWWLFFEEYRWAERRGRLRALELPEDGEPGEAVDALVEPFHLSYPMTFEWRGETWMVPEMAAAGQVRLYRCRRFPGEWEQEAVLLDGVRAVDATLHEEDGRWWMFVDLAVPGTHHAHDELHLFHAASPLGPWEPVPSNPVVSDVRGARPAGRLFRRGGALYRPAQDCSRRYGWRVVLHRVRRLGRDGYREEPVARLDPGWRPGLLAWHTFNRADGLTAVDGMRRLRGSGGGG